MMITLKFWVSPLGIQVQHEISHQGHKTQMEVG